VTQPDPDGGGPLTRPLTTYRYDESQIGDAAGPGASLHGLQAAYYNNVNLTGRPDALQTDSNVDFSWPSGPPPLPGVTHNFSVRWSGDLLVTNAGSYTFSTPSTYGGTRLTVDAVQAINNWTSPFTASTSQPFSLNLGLHRITLEYFDDAAGTTPQVHLHWSGPGINDQLVPASVLRPAWFNQTSSVSPAGRVSFSHFSDSAAGHPDYSLVKLADGTNVITSYAYDTYGRLTQKVMPKGNAGRNNGQPLDGQGNLQGTADVNYAITYAYYPASGAGSMQPPPTACGGGTAVYQSQLPLSTTPHGIATSTYVYNTAGRAIAKTNGAGTTCFYYDDEGRLTRAHAPGDSQDTTYTYDPAGATRTASDASGSLTTEYDEAGRVGKTTDSYGTQAVFTYDEDSNLISRTATTAGGGGSYSFDGVNDMMSRAGAPVTAEPFTIAVWHKRATNPTTPPYTSAVAALDANQTSNGAYYLASSLLANDDLQAVSRNTANTSAQANSTGAGLGAWESQVGVWAASNDRRSYRNGADKGTNATSITGVGSITHFRLGYFQAPNITLGYLKGNVGYAFVWNVALTDQEVADWHAGSIPQPTHLIASYDLTRDYGTGPVPDLTGHGYDLTINGATYDNTQTPPTNYVLGGASTQATTNYGYNDADQLTSATDTGANNTYSFFYDARGNLHATQYPNGTYSWQDVNPDGWVTAVYNRHGTLAAPLPASVPADTQSSPLVDYSYGYDLDGRKTQETRSGGGLATQVYDNAGRLSQVTLPSGTCRKYAYDLDSNRTQIQEAPSGCAGSFSTTASYSYDQTNPNSPGLDQLTSVNQGSQTNYTYNTDGEVSQRGSDTISWDGRGRMTGGTFSGTTVSYGFDAAGRRRSRNAAGKTTHYLFAGTDSPLFETDAGGTVTQTYVDAGGSDLAHYAGPPTSGTTVSYLYDNAHGDLGAEANSSGTRTAAYTYDPFGAANDAVPSNSTTERWTGRWDKQLDTSTNLIQMGARPYDPNLGRFYAVDPVDGGSLNNYDYAGQDPINAYDLDGTCVCALNRAKKAVTSAIAWAANKAVYGASSIVLGTKAIARHEVAIFGGGTASVATRIRAMSPVATLVASGVASAASQAVSDALTKSKLSLQSRAGRAFVAGVIGAASVAVAAAVCGPAAPACAVGISVALNAGGQHYVGSYVDGRFGWK
jgi:RHS repeat-associated protein